MESRLQPGFSWSIALGGYSRDRIILTFIPYILTLLDMKIARRALLTLLFLPWSLAYFGLGKGGRIPKASVADMWEMDPPALPHQIPEDTAPHLRHWWERHIRCRKGIPSRSSP